MWYLIGGSVIIVMVARKLKRAEKEVKEEMKKDIEAAEKEASFYERMQAWKYANKVINECFKIESE